MMRSTLCFVGLLVLGGMAAPYRDLLSKPDSRHGLVTVRTVEKPSRAHLDAAAWIDNSLFVSPGAKDSVEKNGKKLDWFACSLVVKVASQPKVGVEPLSFMAIKRYASLDAGYNQFNEIYSGISKIGTAAPQRVYIQFGKNPQLWIEMTESRTRQFLLIRKEAWFDSTGKLEKWLQQYQQVLKTPAEVLDWATQTASYWYPSLNTDLVWDLPDSSWPGDIVEANVRAAMGKTRVSSPTIVIRGNPLGTPHYTVIQIPGMKPVAQRNVSRSDEGIATSTEKFADRQLPVNYVRNMERIQAELQGHGGSFDAWANTLAPWRTRIQQILDTLPATQMGIEGTQQLLFFRRSLKSLVAGDPELQLGTAAPLPALIAFKGKLEEAEVNMLFIPVPTKAELYAGLLPGMPSLPKDGMLNPWERKFILDAQDEGLEIVDLLPPFLDARKQDQASSEPLYQKDDTHWTRRGMLVAAQIIADRIKQYSWYSELNPQVARFKTKDTTYTRLGDIVERLPTERQSLYSPAQLAGTRVLVQDSVPYQGPKGSPIILIGDSFTGVMESVDCKNGGVGAHIARLTGLDVEVITSWGGGPNVRAKFLKARKAQLAQARLVIYMMTARDLWEYPGGWDALESQ